MDWKLNISLHFTCINQEQDDCVSCCILFVFHREWDLERVTSLSGSLEYNFINANPVLYYLTDNLSTPSIQCEKNGVVTVISIHIYMHIYVAFPVIMVFHVHDLIWSLLSSVWGHYFHQTIAFSYTVYILHCQVDITIEDVSRQKFCLEPLPTPHHHPPPCDLLQNLNTVLWDHRGIGSCRKEERWRHVWELCFPSL